MRKASICNKFERIWLRNEQERVIWSFREICEAEQRNEKEEEDGFKTPILSPNERIVARQQMQKLAIGASGQRWSGDRVLGSSL